MVMQMVVKHSELMKNVMQVISPFFRMLWQFH